MEGIMPRKFDRSPKAIIRRKLVIKQLENQLLTGFKTISDDTGNIGTAPLTEGDKTRIKKELETLKTRL